MERFLSRHARIVTGTLSGFDRLVFRGTLLGLVLREFGMKRYLWKTRVLLKDFAAHAEGLSHRLKQASLALAARSGRPYRYLQSSALSKEAVAREIAAQDGVSDGLICILGAVEPCWSYQVVRDRPSRQLQLVPRQRQCLHLYHYQLDPQLGFMHARIQTWFPFQVQVYVNGREWLGRQMDAAGLGYVRRDNCFTWLEDAGRAQQLIEQQLRSDWPALLQRFARQLNPEHEAMFRCYPVDYYWTVHQSEWASDVMFDGPASLGRLYPKLVHHAMATFKSADVLRFLGRQVPAEAHLPSALKARVTSELKGRPEGVRVKHRLASNSIKMYDKQGSVLRVETTINDAAGFKSFRAPEGRPEAAPAWHRMRKGIADLHRRAEVSLAGNRRYFDALAAVEDTRSLGDLATRLCRPVQRNGRRTRPLNPYAPADAKLLDAISRAEFAINGLRNRDLRLLLFDDAAATPGQQRRHAAAVTRKLALLRDHRLLRKVSGTHRYHLTTEGRTVVAALISARNANIDSLTKLAA